MNPVAVRFGENLGRARRRVGLSQEVLAVRASLHRTEIGLLERGERCPRIDTLVKLAGGLGEPIECALLDGIDWTPGATQVGGFEVESRVERHRAVMERGAELRAGQDETVDPAALVREARGELEKRGGGGD